MHHRMYNELEDITFDFKLAMNILMKKMKDIGFEVYAGGFEMQVFKEGSDISYLIEFGHSGEGFPAISIMDNNYNNDAILFYHQNMNSLLTEITEWIERNFFKIDMATHMMIKQPASATGKPQEPLSS